MTGARGRLRADGRHNTSIRTADGCSMVDGTRVSRPMDRMVRLNGAVVLAAPITKGASHDAATHKTKEIA